MCLCLVGGLKKYDPFCCTQRNINADLEALANRMASEFQRSEVARNVRTTYYGSLTINF